MTTPEHVTAVVAVALTETGIEYHRRDTGQFLAMLAGTQRLRTHCWLVVREHALFVQAFVCRKPDEEQEANWLAGCLLLPRELLLRALKQGLDAVGIAEANAVSLQMANFRLRTTGVERQAAAWRR